MRQELPSRHRVALVVDDDEFVQRFVQQVLENDGFEVYLAESGKTALEMYDNHPGLSLIVTDILMPDTDGIDFILQIRNRPAADAMRPKIIAMSGGGSINADVYLEAVTGLGADETLKKPFSIMDLRQALSRLGFD
jgi:CheY-like chemotaxis protein